MKCPSHVDWVGLGHKVSVLGTMNSDVTRMLTSIRGNFRSYSGETELAGALLSDVQSQFNKLTAFIQSFFLELTTVASFSKCLAWKLIGRCLGGFFQLMEAVRSEVTSLTEVQSIDNKAHMIWTVLWCHAIVEQFISLDFKGHTSMVHQMTLYMMTEWVAPTQVEKVEDAVGTATKAVADAVKMVNKANDMIEKMKMEMTGYKHSINNLKADLENVKKRYVRAA